MRSYPLYSILVVSLIVLAFVKGCGCHSPQPEVHRTTTIEKNITLRSDSTAVVVSFPPKQFSVKGKGKKKGRMDRAIRPDGDSVVTLDSIGYFSPEDTTQVYPDTIALRYDDSTEEFAFSLKTSLRRRLEIVRFLARDSSTLIRDSVLVFVPQESNTLMYSAVALVIGILIGVLAN